MNRTMGSRKPKKVKTDDEAIIKALQGNPNAIPKQVVEHILNYQAEKNVTRESKLKLDPEVKRIFADGLSALNEARVPYLVGAAFARYFYTGIWRETKDLDLFIRAVDLKNALAALASAGFDVSVENPAWLAKARVGPQFIDLIFNTGHGQLVIDDSWFVRSQPVEILGVTSRLVPLEEMIASAAFIAGRNRFDASEVVHLIRSAKGEVDWERILELMGENRELLLWYLILFDYVYPGHAEYLPQDLMVQLFDEARQRWEKPGNSKLFRGKIIDPFSFTVDVEDWGYEDRRILTPLVNEKGELL